MLRYLYVHIFGTVRAYLIPNKISSKVMRESGDEDVSDFHEYKVTIF